MRHSWRRFRWIGCPLRTESIQHSSRIETQFVMSIALYIDTLRRCLIPQPGRVMYFIADGIADFSYVEFTSSFKGKRLIEL
jgi:hypothetical protein